MLKHFNSKQIMTILPSPLILSNFLTGCLEQEDIYLQILSLELIFELLSKHGLDYSEYYSRLYSLLELSKKGYSVFDLARSHIDRFFGLLELSLKSNKLGSRVVGAFVKRLMTLYV